MVETSHPPAAPRAGDPARDSEPGWAPAVRWRPPVESTIDVWSLDLAVAQGEPGLLDPVERARADRFVVEAPRRQFSRARAGLRRILGRVLGGDAREVAFEIGAHGRPSLTAPGGSTGPRGAIDFNLSHSGERALVAVALSPGGEPVQLGIDVEEMRTGRPLDRLAERFFAPREVEQYRRIGPESRGAAFYRAWTRKEAYLKAWGTGLTFSSRRFAIDVEASDRAAADPLGRDLLLATEMDGDDGVGWRFVDLRPAPGYVGALCYRGPVAAVRRFELDPVAEESSGADEDGGGAVREPQREGRGGGEA